MQHIGPHQVVQGFYLGRLVANLQRLGVFEFLLVPRTVDEVAHMMGVKFLQASCVLDYIYQSSDLLVFSSELGYALREEYKDYGNFRFHIDKYLGAYGPLVEQFPEAPMKSSGSVPQDDILATAFNAVAGGHDAVVEVLQQWTKGAVLDLGCGPGSLLTSLCQTNLTCQAWGVDINPMMCRLARARVRRAGLGARISILQGDCRNLETLLGRTKLAMVDLIYGSSIVNEFFQSSPSGAVDFLRYLCRTLPERLFVISDYYGRLGNLCERDLQLVETYNHDLVQMLSGQGVPPNGLEGWYSLYRAAGCSLIQIYETEATDPEWFVHVVRLGDA